MDTGHTLKTSFFAGYDAVKLGKITTELTNREIRKKYPDYNVTAFALGMIDALADDAGRYDRLKKED